MYICTVTVHLNSRGVYLHIFTPTDVGFFCSRCVNLVSFSILEDYRWADVVALIPQKENFFAGFTWNLQIVETINFALNNFFFKIFL